MVDVWADGGTVTWCPAPVAQSAERLHGREKVRGSIPRRGSIACSASDLHQQRNRAEAGGRGENANRSRNGTKSCQQWHRYGTFRCHCWNGSGGGFGA